MITHYQLFIPVWNNPLGRCTKLFAPSFLGNFVHSVDRDIVNKVGGSTDMLLTRTIIWPQAAIGASLGTIYLWTVVGFDRGSFHGRY
jgi:hypothetical protein